MKYKIVKKNMLSGKVVFEAYYKKHLLSSWKTIDIDDKATQFGIYIVPKRYDTIEEAFRAIQDNWDSFKDQFVVKQEIYHYSINEDMEVEIDD